MTGVIAPSVKRRLIARYTQLTGERWREPDAVLLDIWKDAKVLCGHPSSYKPTGAGTAPLRSAIYGVAVTLMIERHPPQ